MEWTAMLAASDQGVIIATTAIGVGGAVFIVAIFIEQWTKRAKIREREQSRREIAAYVAEGTMTVEQGERLMQAGQAPRKGDSDAKEGLEASAT